MTSTPLQVVTTGIWSFLTNLLNSSTAFEYRIPPPAIIIGRFALLIVLNRLLIDFSLHFF